MKGRRFNTIILDDVGEVEVSDERMKAAIEWHKKTQALLKEEETKLRRQEHFRAEGVPNEDPD